MKKFILSVMLAFFCAFSLVVVSTAKAEASDESEIRALYQRFSAAFRNRDLNGIMSVYVHDNSLFVFDVTPPREHVGWNSYRDDWRVLFNMLKGPVQFSIHDLHITTSGDVAYTNSAQEVRANMTNAPKVESRTGGKVRMIVRVTDVLRRIAGKWLIVQEHASVPVDVVTGKSDLLSKP